MPLPIYLKSIILAASAQYSVSPYTIAAVAKIESSYNPKAVGKAGELGLMQLRPEHFPGAGNLLDPKTNIFTAAKFLSELTQRCSHRSYGTFVVCYNLGVRRASSIKNPLNQSYYIKFRRELAQLKQEGTFD